MDNKKIEKFVEEYRALVTKHGVDFGNFPQFIPDGTGAFKIVVQSMPIDMAEMEKLQKAQEGFIKK